MQFSDMFVSCLFVQYLFCEKHTVFMKKEFFWAQSSDQRKSTINIAQETKVHINFSIILLALALKVSYSTYCSTSLIQYIYIYILEFFQFSAVIGFLINQFLIKKKRAGNDFRCYSIYFLDAPNATNPAGPEANSFFSTAPPPMQNSAAPPVKKGLFSEYLVVIIVILH